MVNNRPALRVGDPGIHAACCGANTWQAAQGSATVFINGKNAHRVGDQTKHCGGIGTLIEGSPTVFPGGPPTASSATFPFTTAPSNGPFASPEAAARDALTYANTDSIRDNKEYGGVIYRDADGQYYYTGPVRGTDTGFEPGQAPAPAGTSVVGDYHTHGDYSLMDSNGDAVRTSDPARDDFDSDNFSGDDRDGVAKDAQGSPGYKGYLGTPSGTFKQYDPATGDTTVLQ